jgi:hypothetical protein
LRTRTRGCAKERAYDRTRGFVQALSRCNVALRLSCPRGVMRSPRFRDGKAARVRHFVGECTRGDIC